MPHGARPLGWQSPSKPLLLTRLMKPRLGQVRAARLRALVAATVAQSVVEWGGASADVVRLREAWCLVRAHPTPNHTLTRRGAWLGFTLPLTRRGAWLGFTLPLPLTPDPNRSQVRLREAWCRCVGALGPRSEGLGLGLPARRN
jgi:hypothetical protein